MHFLVDVVLFVVLLHSNSTTMKFLSLGSFGDLGQRLHVICLSTFLKGFSETTGLISLEFHMRLLAKGERKFTYLVQVT